MSVRTRLRAVLSRASDASVVDDEGGGGRREDRRHVRDVRLPDIGELVPLPRVGVGQENRPRTVGSVLLVPRQQHPRPHQHDRPGHHGHHAHPDPQLRDACSDAFRRQVLAAQPGERGQRTGEREQERPSDQHSVRQRPDLASRQLHRLKLRRPSADGFADGRPQRARRWWTPPRGSSSAGSSSTVHPSSAPSRNARSAGRPGSASSTSRPSRGSSVSSWSTLRRS